jgi:hypothetical protein
MSVCQIRQCLSMDNIGRVFKIHRKYFKSHQTCMVRRNCAWSQNRHMDFHSQAECPLLPDLRFSPRMKIHVEVFWIVTPCGIVVGYQRFGGPCCLHLQGEMKAPKRWYPSTTLHGVTTQKTSASLSLVKLFVT